MTEKLISITPINTPYEAHYIKGADADEAEATGNEETVTLPVVALGMYECTHDDGAITYQALAMVLESSGELVPADNNEKFVFVEVK